MKRISDMEIAKASAWNGKFGTDDPYRKIAQAQLDDDKKAHELAMETQAGYLYLSHRAEIRKILNLFERSRALDGSMWWRVMPEEQWQALKEGYTK